MAILNFPNTGLYDGYQWTGDNGVTYIYDGIKWVGHAVAQPAGTSSITNNGNTLQIDPTGNIIIPTGAFIYYESGEPLSDRLISGGEKVILGADGSLTFPTLTTLDWDRRTLNGPTLQMGNDPNVSEVVITGPTPNLTNPNAVRMIIQGQEGYGPGFGSGQAGGYEGGDVYVWAGHGGEGADYSGNGGDVKLRGGIGGLNGGYIRLESGNANASNGNGGFLDLNAGNANATGGTGGDVNIRAGYGAANSGDVNVSTNNGQWVFTQDGRLRIANAYALTAAQNTFINAGSAPTVVYTSLDGTIGSVKAIIKVFTRQADNIDGDHDEDTQICEMLVTTKARYLDNGGVWIRTAVASVYGVTHTSLAPLATFTVNFVENYVAGAGAQPRDVVQILAEPTAAVTGTQMWVMVTATELTND